MTDSHDVPADRRRRVLLGASGAALALGAASARAGGGRPTSPLYAIARLRYAMSADAYLPTVGDTYVLPLSMLSATDGSADSTLNADNTITINTTGMYRILLSVDWIGAHGHDSALRTAGLRRRPAGSQRIVTSPGVLTRIADTDEQLATQDLPGSATPPTVRFPAPPDGAKTVVTPFPWTPGTIAAFSAVDVDVTMPIVGVVKPGDVALASLSSLSTAAMDVNALDALSISAKVIAADTVRVSVLNTSNSTLTVPQGDLGVLGMNSSLTTGGSGEARTLLSTVISPLDAGDTVYAIFSSLGAGDFMQATQQLYVQVEKWTQTA